MDDDNSLHHAHLETVISTLLGDFQVRCAICLEFIYFWDVAFPSDFNLEASKIPRLPAIDA